jgi:hypothetical protein
MITCQKFTKVLDAVFFHVNAIFTWEKEKKNLPNNFFGSIVKQIDSKLGGCGYFFIGLKQHKLHTVSKCLI